jgi:hypothetical protein
MSYLLDNLTVVEKFLWNWSSWRQCMDVLQEDFARSAKRQGRQASATVSGRRRAGFLVGNKFVFSDQAEVLWMEAGPGEFRELRLWRK